MGELGLTSYDAHANNLARLHRGFRKERFERNTAMLVFFQHGRLRQD
jgi:hypothetical protein